jgi:hypothetical protein
MVRHLVGLCIVLAGLPSTVAAQQISFSLDGFGGVFIPASALSDSTGVDFSRTIQQQTTWAVGGRAALWLSRRFAIEAEAAYTASDLEVSGAPVDTTLAANAFLAAISALYTIVDPPFEPISIYVSGGVGLVGRGGDAFDTFFESASDVAAVVGLGVRYGIGHGMRIRVDIKDYISSFQDESVGGDAKLQNDLLLTGGLQLTFGER